MVGCVVGGWTGAGCAGPLVAGGGLGFGGCAWAGCAWAGGSWGRAFVGGGGGVDCCWANSMHDANSTKAEIPGKVAVRMYPPSTQEASLRCSSAPFGRALFGAAPILLALVKVGIPGSSPAWDFPLSPTQAPPKAVAPM